MINIKFMDEHQQNNSNDAPEETEISSPQYQLPEPLVPPVQSAFLALIAVFLLYQVGGSILTLAIFGFDFQKADINAVRLLTGAGQIVFILVPALIFAKFVFHDVTPIIRFRWPRAKDAGIFVIGLIILVPLLQSYLYLQNYVFQILADNNGVIKSIKEFLDVVDKFVEQTYSDLLKSNNIFETILIIFIVAVVPAACEEIFFRGFIQKSFEYRYKPYSAALLTAFFFGLYHFNPYGLVALVALGTYLGYAAYKSDSIAVPVLLHFLNNFIAIMAFFIFGNEEFMTSNVKTEEFSGQMISFGILIFIFVAFIAWVNKYYKNLQLNKE
ncbi:MAG: CPBP family intramembrane metalloprotease domain-containing protein [Ignavibacteriae bacterium HGW-Ignavibacteriae-2]|nr:MAG: CPBP family intramembrane metalloprotease domain-containing protein [Ignavibacteriae bacterium HGW-Ignavibacteriae-2]